MKILIAAGGTGGHVFPGLAVAETFVAGGADREALFVGTEAGLESKVIPEKGFRLIYISAYQFRGQSILHKLGTLLRLLRGVGSAMSILCKEKPDAVLGMGGFTSVPVVLAASLLRVPAFIHEQNVEPGLANKMLSRYVKATFISFEGSRQYLKGKTIYHSGNPLRRSLGPSGKRKKDGTFGVFIFGGSRGARRVNESIMTLLPFMEGYTNVAMYHQTGFDDFGWVREGYEKSGVRHEVFPFTESMEKYYNMSDVVISRAGATTIFELAYFRKPAILIPYPFSAGQHQWKNASYVESVGGGHLIGDDEATGDRIHGVLKRLVDDPVLLREMGENIGRLYVEDAGERIIKGMIDGIS
jgi:UDP-N-acetylglucosamine--N-acetylmuramyl-(pentapeptide) pyrophosphoryl-undecaprenol N-acetylglucosamine transferase